MSMNPWRSWRPCWTSSANHNSPGPSEPTSDDPECQVLQPYLCSGLTCRQAIHNPALDWWHTACVAHQAWHRTCGSLSLEVGIWWKAIRLRQYAIELLDHVSHICILSADSWRSQSLFNCWSNAWSQADHGTAHSGTHSVCKGTIGMIRILVAQLDAH